MKRLSFASRHRLVEVKKGFHIKSHPELVELEGSFSFGWYYPKLMCRVCDMELYYVLSTAEGAFGGNPDNLRIHQHLNKCVASCGVN
jgi:hypothetical protein